VLLLGFQYSSSAKIMLIDQLWVLWQHIIGQAYFSRKWKMDSILLLRNWCIQHLQCVWYANAKT